MLTATEAAALLAIVRTSSGRGSDETRNIQITDH
jgi:hypothetical protein